MMRRFAHYPSFYCSLATLNEIIIILSADVKMPSGNIDKPSIEDNHDGTVSIRYDPREEGAHELTLKYNGENVQGNFTNMLAS